MPKHAVVVAAIALAGCTPSSPAPAPPPVASARLTSVAPPPVASAPTAPPAPADPCAPHLAAERAAIASIAGRADMVRPALESFGRCLRTPDGGAWVVVVTDLAGTPADPEGSPEVAKGRWAVLRVGPGGAIARSARDEEWSPYAARHVEHASLVDFDGDGAPELVLATHVHAHEGADGHDGEVLASRGGSIAPYAPADGVGPDEARDVDGDGRPDLVTHRPYVADGDDSPSGFTYLMRGPALLAHALPGGGFARGDAAAKAFARAACPAKNARVLGASADDAATDVVCARVWGVPAAAVARAITARCASVAETESGRPKRPRCGDVRVLAGWAALAPPVTLP